MDQVEAYRSTQKTKQQAQPVTASAPSTAKKSSAMGILNAIILYSAAAGGGYWFYQQDIKADQALAAAESRIVDLERQLSATDEEMGESTVAMRAKLEGLIEKTDKLWSEMDKLWASAWRRNQSEIKKLRNQAEALDKTQKLQTKTQTNSSSTLKSLSDNQADMTLKLSLLQEQIDAAQSIKTQLTVMSTDLDKLKSKAQGRDSKQLEIGSSIAQLEMTQSAIVEQLERLESQLTATASSPAQEKLN